MDNNILHIKKDGDSQWVVNIMLYLTFHNNIT